MGRQQKTSLGKADNKGQREGVQGDTKGRQDPRENKHPIQQRETRRGTILGKVDAPSNRGYKVNKNLRKGEHTIKEGVQGESKPSGHSIQEGVQRESRPSGRWTHQVGHLKNTLRTPNSRLFGEKEVVELENKTKQNITNLHPFLILFNVHSEFSSFSRFHGLSGAIGLIGLQSPRNRRCPESPKKWIKNPWVPN